MYIVETRNDDGDLIGAFTNVSHAAITETLESALADIAAVGADIVGDMDLGFIAEYACPDHGPEQLLFSAPKWIDELPEWIDDDCDCGDCE